MTLDIIVGRGGALQVSQEGSADQELDLEPSCLPQK